MRFLHLADTHLGFRQFAGRLDPERGINQREADVYRAWHHAVGHAVSAGVDAVVHAGDLFDGPRPTPRALAEALDGFARLHAAGIPAIVIAGNHSTPRTRSGGSVFEVIGRFPGVHAVWEGPRRIDLGGVSFHAVPHDDDGAVGRLALGPGRNVLIAHGGMGAARATYSEPGAVELDRDAVVSAGVDYVALGHLHAFARMGANTVYAGSLERLDFADESSKVLVVADLEGELSVIPAPFRPVFTVPVACRGLGPAEVLDAVAAAVAARECRDAVVRLRLDGLARDVYQALDLRRIGALLADALHFVLAVGPAGLAAVAAEHEEAVGFDAFARARVPDGVDAARVVALARGFLAAAGAEEVAREA
jgi:DNA repair exonuclease SbcCD nuclease subunit